MSDLISRSDAINAIRQRFDNVVIVEEAVEALEGVPEADLSCGDCIYNDGKLYATCEGCARAGFDNYTQEGGN